MPLLAVKTGEETAFFENAIATSGVSLRDQYAAGDPFPHVVIDDFLPDAILDRVLDEWPEMSKVDINRVQQRLKAEYAPDALSTPFARSLFYAFNAAPFLKFLEGVTGVTGLLPDPYFKGGGFHEIKSGGHLSIHADFNLYKPLRMLRRVNVVVYLNKEWLPEYGGNLELWSKDMKVRVKSIEPLFNRCVIFGTTDDTFHGHPEPLATPAGRTRRSLAVYYYTASDSIVDEHRFHTSVFKARPSTTDRPNTEFMLRDLLVDCTPPIMKRAFKKLTAGRAKSAAVR